MNARWMCEGIRADNRFIWLHHHPHFFWNQTANRVKLMRLNICIKPQRTVLTHHHHDFFKARVARAFANAVDSTFYLTRTIRSSSNRISRCQAQIIMTMRWNSRFMNVRNIIYEVFYQFTVHIRQAIACCIRNIHHRCTCFDDSFYNPRQIFRVGTPCIFAEKLYVFNLFFSVFCSSDGA